MELEMGTGISIYISQLYLLKWMKACHRWGRGRGSLDKIGFVLVVWRKSKDTHL